MNVAMMRAAIATHDHEYAPMDSSCVYIRANVGYYSESPETTRTSGSGVSYSTSDVYCAGTSWCTSLGDLGDDVHWESSARGARGDIIFHFSECRGVRSRRP